MIKQRFKRFLAGGLSFLMAFSPFASAGIVHAAEDTTVPAAYTVTLEETENGSTSFKDSDKRSLLIQEGEEVTVNISPNEGYEFESIAVNATSDGTLLGESKDKQDAFVFAMPNEDVKVEATFVASDKKADNAETEKESGAAKTETASAEEKTDVKKEATGNTEAPVESKEKVEPTPHDVVSSETEEDIAARLLVKTDDEKILKDGTILGSVDDMYLVGFASEKEADKAAKSLAKEADAVGSDMKIFIADDEMIAQKDVDTEINPFAELEKEVKDVSPVKEQDVIALIDTGASKNANVVERYSVIGDEVGDDNGHGDKMVETIVRQNPDAKIISIKAMDANGEGSVSSLYAAIVLAMEKGVRIINLSVSAYSGEENKALEEIVVSAADQGIAVIGAAGNQGMDSKYFTPGNIDRAIIVGFRDKEGLIHKKSNYGDLVDYYVMTDSSSDAAAVISARLAKDGAIHVDNEFVFDGTNNTNVSKNEEAPVVYDYRFVTQRLGNRDDLFEEDGTATIIPGREVYYDLWSTCLFTVRDEDGDHLGFCLQPNKPTPSGTYTKYHIDPSGGRYDFEALVNIILASPYGTTGYYDSSWFTAYLENQGSDDLNYAFAHAGLAILYSGDRTGLSESGRNAAEALVLRASGAAGDRVRPYQVLKEQGVTIDLYVVTNNDQDIAYIKVGKSQGELDLKKTSANPTITNNNDCYSLEGAVYEVFSDSACTTKVGTLTTKADGTTDAIELDAATYYVKEKTASKGYQLDTTVHSIDVTSGETATLEVEEEPGNDPTVITLAKAQKGNGNTPSLAGAEFTITHYGGIFSTEAAAEAADVAKRTWTVKTVERNGKYAANLFDDSSFISSSSDSRYSKNGGYILPYGTIIIKETKAPTGYLNDPTWKNGNLSESADVFIANITEDGGLVKAGTTNSLSGDFEIQDQEIRGGVKVAKWDKELNRKEAQGDASIQGAVFEIVNNNDYAVTNATGTSSYNKGQVVTTITTGSDGIAQTAANALQAGNYIVREKTAPTGYKNEGDISRAFTITGNGAIVDMTATGTAIKNNAIRGDAELQKLDGDMGLKRNNQPYAEGDKSLKDAEYTLWNRSAHLVKVGSTEYAKDAVIGVYKTNDAGKVTFPNLPYGSYEVKETKASTGYKLDTKSYTFTIRTDGEKKSITSNEPDIKGGVKIQKLDGDMKLRKDNKPYAEGDKSLQDAVYTIYNVSNHDIIKDGKIIATAGKGSTNVSDANAVMTLTTDANGQASTGASDLPYGTYLIKETKASTGYKLDTSYVKVFAIREDGKIVDLTSAADASYEPDIKGGVKIQKLDEDVRLDLGEDGKESENGVPYAEGDKSLQGAEYSIYNVSTHDIVNKNGDIVATAGKGKTDVTDANLVQVLTTDANGVASTGKSDLPYGTYLIKETKASEGYLIDEDWIKVFEIREDGKIVEFTSEQDASYEPDIKGGFEIQKMDLETMLPFALGGADLSGINFNLINMSKHTVKNPNGRYVAVGEVYNDEPLTTDENGHFKSEERYLPYGTYKIQELPVDDLEVSVNDSYLIKGTEDLTFQIREDSVFVTKDAEGNDIQFANQVKRQDLLFRKVNEKDETMGDMEPIAFVITQLKTGEKHVVVTDTNGQYNSDKYNHSRKTNANDAILESYVDGETVIKSADLDFKAGTWFGLSQDGETMAEVDNKLPAFPYGEYLIEELRCEGNESYDLIEPYRFIVDEDRYEESRGYLIELNNIHNRTPQAEIRTMALGSETKEHLLLASEDATLVDTVHAEGLVKGQKYIMSATLMDADEDATLKAENEDGKMRTVKAEVEFTATSATMDIEVPLSLNAKALAGKTIVVFEKLYTAKDDGKKGEEVANHEEIDDKDQTVFIPEIGTTATDAKTGSQTGKMEETITINDAVKYDNLIPGKTYSLKYTPAYQDENGETVLLEKYAGEVEFTPEKASGEEIVTVTIDSADLPVAKVVMFEKVHYNGVPVAIHADINDENQTVRYPSIGTRAWDGKTEDHVGVVEDKATVVDTVSYKGLTPGTEYIMKSQLIDKETGEPIAEAQSTFTPASENGEVNITFEVDSTALAGKDVVAFEKCLISTILPDGGGAKLDEIATHEDLNDEGQTVHYPEIRTKAALDEQKVEKGILTIVDKVTYKNLIPGKTYDGIKGTLMDKATGEAIKDADGNPVQAVSEPFTPKEADGSVDVVFTLPYELMVGKTAVVFEELIYNEITVAVHADLEDKEQTVPGPTPEIRTTASIETPDKPAEGTTYIKDVVKYTGLTPGVEYDEIVGKLVYADGENKGEFVKDGDKIITASTGKFTPKESDGEITVTFAVPTRLVEARKIVVFEDLMYKGVSIATHSDITDQNQTVFVPKLATQAKDGATGNHVGTVTEKATIIDTVAYEGMQPGEHIMRGELYDKTAGKLTGIKAEKAYTVKEGETSGKVEMTFTLDASKLEGKTYVVFEEDFLITKDKDGKATEVSTGQHKDPNDEDQSIHYPKIRTTAKAKDGSKNIIKNGTQTVIDTVTYENLIPGHEYVVKGNLMTKSGSTLGITAEAALTPKEANGSVDLTFTVDSSKLGNETLLVVFEKLFDKASGKEVARHEDLTDKAQTISITTTESPKPSITQKVATGDMNLLPLIIAGAAIAAIAAALVIRRKRNSR